MESPDYLPLGSIVNVRGNTKKLMVISRAVTIPEQEERHYYDYGGCLYPEGLMGDTVVYFNHDAVQKVYFTGYTDDEDKEVVSAIRETLERLDLVKGDPAPFSIPGVPGEASPYYQRPEADDDARTEGADKDGQGA
ncbi:MAG: DUF4176 domain-containing protein [Coriobacteriales bacterium]